MDILTSIKDYFSSDLVQNDYLKFLSGLIAIPSVSSSPDGPYIFGKESAKALSYVVNESQRMGFQSEHYDWRCASAFLSGKQNDEIGLICHADVVPAASDWHFDPYQLTNQDGLLIGRGVMDDKGPLALSLFSMKFFKDNNYQLPFGLRLIVGGSEEVGTGDINYYIETGHKPPRFSFTPDSSFPVCCAEKGIASFNAIFPPLGEDILFFHGGTVTNAVPDYAECVLNIPFNTNYLSSDVPNIKLSEYDGLVKITASGVAAHAAMPEGSVNAIVLLATYLLDSKLLKTSESDISMRFIVATASDYLGKGFNIDCNDTVSGALTCILGIAKSTENCFSLNYNIRYPQGISYDTYIVPRLCRKINQFGAKYEFVSGSKGYAYSPEMNEIKLLSDAYSLITGKQLPPYSTGGGTYARAFPNTVAFGPESDDFVSPMGIGRGGIHQSDECVSLKYLMTCGEIYTAAIAHLAGLI